MRFRALLLTAATLQAGASFADVTLTSTVTDSQAARLDRLRVKLNTQTCADAGLPPSCTQPQARAVNPGASIYVDVQDFFNRYMVRNAVQDLQDKQNREDTATLCQFFGSAAGAQRQAACDAVGATACPSECR